MTTGTVNISNAPRDLDKLQILGPFMLKTLMQSAAKELNFDWDDTKKQAFMRDPINKRAEDVLNLLQQIDGKGGVSTPAPAAAPPPAATATKREPVAASKMANGANGAAAHAAPVEGMAVLANMAEILKEVSESQKGVATMLGEINKSIKESNNVKKDVATLAGQVTQLFRLQHLTLGVLAQLAEQQLNAPFKDVLDQVANEYGAYEATVTGLVSGK